MTGQIIPLPIAAVTDSETVMAEVTRFLRTGDRKQLRGTDAMAAAVVEWWPDVQVKPLLGHFAWLAVLEEAERRLAAAMER